MSSTDKFLYSLTHPTFYEPLDRHQVRDDAFIRIVKALIPDSWQIIRGNIWLNCTPPVRALPLQGWKIHLSATTATAESILRSAVPVLVSHGTAFKFAADPAMLLLLTSKQWYRGGAGKFVTIYPRDEQQFATLLESLRAATDGQDGPYILSDRRYKDCKCVYYRYGGIAPRSNLTVKGERQAFLTAPDGAEVPDQRLAWFSLPGWVTDPFYRTEPSASSHPQNTLKNGRYLIESALRFSNSGGLYKGVDRHTGMQVVIKEARPLINVDQHGNDAVAFLRKEYRLLTKLQGFHIAPQPVDLFYEWEHCFLVEEFINGLTLRQHSVLHNVTRDTAPTQEYASNFLETIRPVFVNLCKLLQVLQANQVVFRDLSPTNVLVAEDDTVKVVDFEAACEIGVDLLTPLFTPGFATVDHFNSSQPRFENDYFSLGALMLAYFMPIQVLMGLDPDAHVRFIRSIGRDYGIPPVVSEMVAGLMNRDPEQRPPTNQVISILESVQSANEPQLLIESGPEVRDLGRLTLQIINYVLSVATYDRSDRLFPADPKVFLTNPLGVAYGACGIAYAVQKITGSLPESIIEWILAREISRETYAPGLYVGLSGIAWALLELGQLEKARELLALIEMDSLAKQSADIFYGLSGVGMTYLKFFQELGDSLYLRQAFDIGEELLRTCGRTTKGCYWGKPGELTIGYAHGSSGVALFLLYLYLASGDQRFLDTGEAALSFDLAHAVNNGAGLAWPTREGPRRSIVPYWRYGSAGVGSVLVRYCALGREKYLTILAGIVREVDRKYAIFPGRLFGLVGLGEFLLDLADYSNDSRCIQSAKKVARGIMLFQIQKGKKYVAFPGADLWKISCDYGTGSAGIALFFHRLMTRCRPDFMVDKLLAQRTKVSPLDLQLVYEPHNATVDSEVL